MTIEQGIQFENRQNAIKALFELYGKYRQEPIDKNQRHSDIWEHLPQLFKYTKEYDHITEVGTRHGISTTALMCGMPKKLVCYDLAKTEEVIWLQRLAKVIGIDFDFKQQDILKCEIEETDVYFCDAFHQNNFVRKELSLHADKVKHLLIFHDVKTYGYGSGEPYYGGVDDIELDGKGIMYAIDDFMKDNPQWEEVYRTERNNGLLILRKNTIV